ncbi:MAG: hypothetical protein ACPMAQ_18545, partial [Phycisphaerae bacterium]
MSGSAMDRQAYAAVGCANHREGVPPETMQRQGGGYRRGVGAEAGRRYRVCLAGIWPGVTGADFVPVVSPERPRFTYAEAFDAAVFRIVDRPHEHHTAGGAGRRL